MPDKPALGSTTVSGVAEFKDANGNPVIIPISIDTGYSPARLIVELPDRALRDLGIIDIGDITDGGGVSVIDDAAHAINVIGGNLNTVTVEAAYTSAQTNVAIVTVGAGTRIACTAIEVTADHANTLDVGYRIGFAAATTPTTTGVLTSHPGLAAGSGVIKGNGMAIIGVGADGEDLRITSEDPGGALRVVVTYYTVAE